MKSTRYFIRMGFKHPLMHIITSVKTKNTSSTLKVANIAFNNGFLSLVTVSFL